MASLIPEEVSPAAKLGVPIAKGKRKALDNPGKFVYTYCESSECHRSYVKCFECGSATLVTYDLITTACKGQCKASTRILIRLADDELSNNEENNWFDSWYKLMHPDLMTGEGTEYCKQCGHAIKIAWRVRRCSKECDAVVEFCPGTTELEQEEDSVTTK